MDDIFNFSIIKRRKETYEKLNFLKHLTWKCQELVNSYDDGWGYICKQLLGEVEICSLRNIDNIWSYLELLKTKIMNSQKIDNLD